MPISLSIMSSGTRAPKPSSRRVCDALVFKTDVLWAQLDALYFAYVEPGLAPPGAFVPDA